MRPLIECVPNFSEGRRQDVVDAIVEVMARAGGVHILDVSCDSDHNRSVVTLVGLPEEVEKAVFAGIRTAAELIDLNEHSGEHPRFGAADVVPLVPIRDVTLDDCVKLAHQLGQRVASELNLPVYFYESAALRPDYENLSHIRNPAFQYEQLREAISVEPRWMPDVGPAEVGTAGAVLIGARLPLIAYNVFLNTDNVDIARKIASAIRQSDGGLRYVKSSGFLVRGRAQVSMNLTNYEKTPLFRVMELIRREAARYGVMIESSELIGLIPEAALRDSAVWYLQLDDFSVERVLEYRIAQAEAQPTALSAEEPPVPDDATSQIAVPDADTVRHPELFPGAVAQPTPTPGGGSVVSLCGALAAALTEMVAGLTIGRRRYIDVEEQMTAIKSTANRLRDDLIDSIGRDIDSIDNLMHALRAAKSDPDQVELIQQATLAAADSPLHTARLIYEVMQLLEQVTESGNRNAVIDAAVGAQVALAAVEGAVLNVRANLLGITDPQIIERYSNEIDHILQDTRAICPRIIATATHRIGLTEEP